MSTSTVASAMRKPPHERKQMRSGYTTGACSAAAARAATRFALSGAPPAEVGVRLPNRQQVCFPIHRAERTDAGFLCSVIKDAGDDPDVTHGAELVAVVTLTPDAGVELLGGEGVATVTKPGLGLEVGTSAINPVPRRNITEMVLAELSGSPHGARVTIHVPGGEEMAQHTLNARLGLVGGISILGTSGIVKPYSTAAYMASVVQAIDVAHRRGYRVVVVTTGGKSERYAMDLHPELPQDAFIQVGDFIGVGLKHARRVGLSRVVIVGMIGKLSKMADGVMQTHQAGSRVNHDLLAELASVAGADEGLVAEIRAANTARHVLELCTEAGFHALAGAICERVSQAGHRHVGGSLPVVVQLVDFEGELLGSYEPRETV